MWHIILRVPVNIDKKVLTLCTDCVIINQQNRKCAKWVYACNTDKRFY